MTPLGYWFLSFRVLFLSEMLPVSLFRTVFIPFAIESFLYWSFDGFRLLVASFTLWASLVYLTLAPYAFLGSKLLVSSFALSTYSLWLAFVISTWSYESFTVRGLLVETKCFEFLIFLNDGCSPTTFLLTTLVLTPAFFYLLLGYECWRLSTINELFFACSPSSLTGYLLEGRLVW